MVKLLHPKVLVGCICQILGLFFSNSQSFQDKSESLLIYLTLFKKSVL